MMAKVYYFKKGGVRVTSLDQVRDLLDEIGIPDDGSNTRLYLSITGKEGVSLLLIILLIIKKDHCKFSCNRYLPCMCRRTWVHVLAVQG